MSDAIIGTVLTQLGSILEREIQQELRLVVGVDKDIENLKRTFRSISSVLLDAEMRRVKKDEEKEGLEIWLQNLQEVSYDMDDILAEWSNALLKIEIEGLENTTPKKKVCFFINSPCFCFSKVFLRRDIALKIQEINERLDFIDKEKLRYNLKEIENGEAPNRRLKTVSHIDLNEACGRDGEQTGLVRELLKLKENSRADRGLHLVSIVGMGGIGKTFLAQLAYHSADLETHFDKRIWVCVSEPFDASRIAKAIIEGVDGHAPNLVEFDPIMTKLRNSIAGKRFLLVLDDVWTQDHEKWEPLRISLKNGVPGSKILVTTRNERVAKMMGSSYTLKLGQLSKQDCWSLFSQIAYFDRSKQDREELEDIGKKLAAKCKGLPLAAKTVGSLMRFKNSIREWQSVLDNFMWGLEETKEGPFPPLLLSYYDLHPSLRRCFSYCAIFPKDCKIEADNLIKLWMAQGYIDTEIRGREFLDNLISRCFFQELEKDKDTESIVRFKMHDMVHDFAQYLTKNECYMTEVDNKVESWMNSSCSKARHLTLVRAEDVHFPVSIGNIEKPHTFLVQSFYDCPALVSEEDKVSPDLFNQLLHVKALDLSRNRLLELPDEIGKLMNIRYLNLSHNPLGELPETICGLYNLQTLKLVACKYLRRLPQGIGQLKNLRHLEIDGTEKLEALPKGIGRLHSLQTLNKFILAVPVNSRNLEERMCKLGELKDLNQLRGRLKMGGLGLVSNVEEAKQAELKNKVHITDLHMDFKVQGQAEGKLDVVEALELHPDLQSLQISFYGATRLPSWITSLTNLRKLQLQDCQNCTELPPLGRLPSLQTLYIENMHDLKQIGYEFLGLGSSSSTMAAIDIFPKLKKLKFDNMRNWEQWEVVNMRIMPCLRYLKLSDCVKLKGLPDYLLQKTPIRKLRINKCPILQQRYQKETGENWIKISHIQKVRIS